MPDRTQAEAARRLTSSLQRAVSCVSDAVLIPGRHLRNPLVTRAILLPQAPILLHGDEALLLDVSYLYRLEEQIGRGGWVARTVGYRFQLYRAGGTELLAYHWHPGDPNPITFPHLHLSAGAQIAFAGLTRAHLPTGMVTLQDVLRLAIEDLGVRPMRSNWLAILSGRPDTPR